MIKGKIENRIIEIKKVDPSIDHYSLVDVVVDGHKLSARPVEFTYDSFGNPTSATKYECTCPNCGNLISFTLFEAVVFDKVPYVGCSNCKKGFVNLGPGPGPGPEPVPKPKVTIIKTGQVVAQTEKKVVVCPFSDPIEDKTFDPLCDYEPVHPG